MRIQKPTILAPIILAVIAGLFIAIVWPIYSVIQSFDHLEENAKRVITAPELQAWATNLLAHPLAIGRRWLSWGQISRHSCCAFITIRPMSGSTNHHQLPRLCFDHLGPWHDWALRFRDWPCRFRRTRACVARRSLFSQRQRVMALLWSKHSILRWPADSVR